MAKAPTCKKCDQEGHYGINCLNVPRKPIKATKKRKPTITQINKKLKEGGNLTKAEEKIQYKKQKDKAWKAFSDYIRHRDCLATTGTFERAMCVTCMVRGDYTEYPYARIQCGHAIPSRVDSILFDEEICNGQHDRCNQQGAGGLGGDYGHYTMFLVKKYGIEHTEALQRKRYEYKKYTYEDLVDIERKYKEKLEELKDSGETNTKLL